MVAPTRWLPLFAVLTLACVQVGCRRAGSELSRRGDEIVVCGRYFHTGAPVVLWTDPGGYDAYRTEKRFVPWEKAAWMPPPPDKTGGGPPSPNRSNIRFSGRLGTSECPLSADDFERIRGGGWDLPTLQKCVDQFVLHYDVCGTSRQCFRVLHDVRGLSVHFMLDIDGTIYQTLDLKERAWHATTSNDRSVGIEIANMGAYTAGENEPLAKWYEPDPLPWRDTTRNCIPGLPPHPPEVARITLPAELGDGGVRKPERVDPVPLIYGFIQGRPLRQFDFTPRQYESLAKLTATLCTVFPEMPCDFPRDASGSPLPDKLSDDALAGYQGLLGHYHIQANKTDPGPAMRWDWLVRTARPEVGNPPK